MDQIGVRAGRLTGEFASEVGHRRIFLVLAIATFALSGCSGSDNLPSDEKSLDALIEVHYVNEYARVDLVYQIECRGDLSLVHGDAPGVHAAEACASLATQRVSKRLVEGFAGGVNTPCTMELAAGTATIQGSINGVRIDTTADRGGGCARRDWERTLGAVLPEPDDSMAPDG